MIIKLLTSIIAAVALTISSTGLAQITETEIPSQSEFDRQQIKCIADTVYYEARGESRAGQIAVANVIVNRAKSRKFPNTPCKVVHQRTGKTCQFMWACKKSSGIKQGALYDKLYRISADVYYSRISDNTNIALYFHAKHVRPSWASKKRYTVTLGSHLFYRG